MSDDSPPIIYGYTAPAGYMSESPAQDAELYRRHLQSLIDANKAASVTSVKDMALMAPMGFAAATAAHGVRGLARVLGGSSSMPFERGATGAALQGAKALGGAGAVYGANSAMDIPISDRVRAFIDAVPAGRALDRENRGAMHAAPSGEPARYADGGGTGSWGDEASSEAQGPSIWQQLSGYFQSLPGRAAVNLAERGRSLRDDPVKEHLRNAYGVGHVVDAYDAFKEGHPWAGAGNATLGALDLAAPLTSPVIATTDAALRAWKLAEQARPGQVAEALAKLTTKRMKPTGYAAERRAAEAERSVPRPEVPAPNGSPQRAQTMLDVIDRTWPGNTMATVGGTAAATGIPGVMLDDATSTAENYLDPMVGQYRTMQQEMAREHEQRAAPLRTDADAHPNIANYQHLQNEARLRRNINAGTAAGESLGGVGATYGAMKTALPALRTTMPGLAADLAMIHPALGLLGLAPLAVPAALGYGSWAAAHDIPERASAALDAHKKSKLIGKILDNYRDPQMKMTADGDY